MQKIGVDSVSSDHPLVEFGRYLEKRPFSPPLWLRGAQPQTLAASLIGRRYSWGWSTYQEEDIDLSDGSRVRSICIWRCPSAPTLVVIHGMGGSSRSTYMLGLSHKAYREGWNAILLNLYTLDQSALLPKIFHAGSNLDVGEILNHLLVKYGLQEIFLVGVSMGGNILLKMLGEWGANAPCPVRAAAAISPLVDLKVSCRMLEKPSNYLFQYHFVKGLKKKIQERKFELRSFVDPEAFLGIKTVREYDRLVTIPLTQFENVEDYYKRASAIRYLKHIRVPTLLIHAQDDPFLPWRPFLAPEVRTNSSFLTCLTARGGHMGFIERESFGDIDKRWAENRVIDYFRMF